MSQQPVNDVTTLKAFLTYVRSHVMQQAKTYNGTFDAYLRSLLAIVNRSAHLPVTYGLLAQILTDAFTEPPLMFDPAWLIYTGPPRDEPSQNADTFARLQHMLCYLIADWHRMDEAGILANEYRYLGVKSPTGHSWYNFDLVTFLECGTAGLGFDRAEDMQEGEYIVLEGGVNFKGTDLLEIESEQGENIPPDWEILTGLLWMGQTYE